MMRFMDTQVEYVMGENVCLGCSVPVPERDEKGGGKEGKKGGGKEGKKGGKKKGNKNKRRKLFSQTLAHQTGLDDIKVMDAIHPKGGRLLTRMIRRVRVLRRKLL